MNLCRLLLMSVSVLVSSFVCANEPRCERFRQGPTLTGLDSHRR